MPLTLGDNRRHVWRESAIRNWLEQNLRPADLTIRSDEDPTHVRIGLTEAEKRTFARTANLLRRSLTRAQMREQIAAQLRDTVHWSNNRIAGTFGVDDKTVAAIRSKLESSGAILYVKDREGANGKARPAWQMRSVWFGEEGAGFRRRCWMPAAPKRIIRAWGRFSTEHATDALAEIVRRLHELEQREDRHQAHTRRELIDMRSYQFSGYASAGERHAANLRRQQDEERSAADRRVKEHALNENARRFADRTSAGKIAFKYGNAEAFERAAREATAGASREIAASNGNASAALLRSD